MLIKQLLIEGIYKNLLNGEFLCNGDRVSVWDDEKLLEMGSGNGRPTMKVLNTTKLYF